MENKKNYEAPKMDVVAIYCHTSLLECSNPGECQEMGILDTVKDISVQV